METIHEDDEDFWDEAFYENYTSPLVHLNELVMFRNCMMEL